MTVRREKIGGLGLSVKGGAEHNLPVLVSRIFKDQAGELNKCFVITKKFLREGWTGTCGAQCVKTWDNDTALQNIENNILKWKLLNISH